MVQYNKNTSNRSRVVHCLYNHSYNHIYRNCKICISCYAGHLNGRRRKMGAFDWNNTNSSGDINSYNNDSSWFLEAGSRNCKGKNQMVLIYLIFSTHP